MDEREGDMKVDKTTERGIGPCRRPAAAPDLAAPGGGGLIAEVYERFPYGVIVVDTGGRMITANARARRILARRYPDEGTTATCCSLFGCRRPDSPLARCCITEVALQTARRLPELRLDVPSAPSGALWVTAAPLDREGSAVVFQMRPGSPQDRRARTRPHWLDGPRLRIFALGGMRVESREGPLTGDWLEQRPGQLLRFLVSERHRIVPTEVIASAVWGQSGRNAPNTVRHFVHALRERLEPDRPKHGESSFVVSRRGGYTLNGERVWLDVDEFEQEVTRGRVAVAGMARTQAIERFERAAELYRDDFLADEPYAEWAFTERERLRAMAGDTLRSLSRLHEHEPHKSASYLERLGGMEPFDNDVHRDLIAALLRVGRRSSAARHYNAFRRRLMDSFGDRPDFELADMLPNPPNTVRPNMGETSRIRLA
jgi:DNA-binding SARP family transcriptional activator